MVTITSKDEIGQLGQAFNDMQESLRTLIQKLNKMQRRLLLQQKS